MRQPLFDEERLHPCGVHEIPYLPGQAHQPDMPPAAPRPPGAPPSASGQPASAAREPSLVSIVTTDAGSALAADQSAPRAAPNKGNAE